MTTLPSVLVGIPGGWEWFLILAVVLIFFGRRIPGVARSLGAGINEFKEGLREGDKPKSRLPEGDDEKRDDSAS